MFKNRIAAGLQLAGKLKNMNIKNGVVMAIPRGGVVLAAEIGRELDMPVDLIIPRKIGAPFNPEMAVGAVTQDGTVIYNRYLMEKTGLSEKDLQKTIDEQIKEIRRRMINYRGHDQYPDYSGRDIILVDDGIATGSTVLAAIRSINNIFKPGRLILAVPVAPPEVIRKLKNEVDDLICLLQPTAFISVGFFYEDFKQVEDSEVLELLRGWS